ncbi:C69 family dipeptidase [Limosilactobacillus mucosae]|uniref:Dipeptidase n=1 Tax=Limosilactobacillus mucosae TaxID=97478 RepID=A0AAJ1MAU1_LIMMU|nr:C69 family dipeptidase [Limosilactobacillus mucosae]MDC2830125.1 C69 family dipeptidase [Limosilactobacillus mucosae]MDC2837583.1 C69 family dipeptidase [Limosilactobacillus mucosae]MDC2849645.1 C69 family dipeptidase [Limosilactobacillus mucosae]MDC2853850.1 C69 family dipeptidase [Limosilactobacillus mucosae]
MKHTCTTFLAGKAATLDGSTLICRQEDYGNAFDPQRFVVVDPKDQPLHYASKTTKFTLELPDNPLKYTSVPDADDSAGVFAAGGINAANVAMTATETATTNARVLGADPYNTESGIGEEDFVVLVLPYIKSAREGVKRLGHLLEQYGTYESNGIAFSDHDEVWYFETIGGHHWAAQKIPDDAYVIAPNQFNIADYDFESDSSMYSADLPTFIKQHHLNPEHGLNLREIFGSRTASDARYNYPRAWYVQRLLSDEAEQQPTDQDLPFICHPKHKLAIEDVKQAMSSHFQQTDYDPYGHGPVNERQKYRPIALNRNLEIHMLQIRNHVPDSIAGVHWLAFGPNTFNAVVPFYANIDDTPAPYKNTTGNFDLQNMYWLTHTIAVLGDQNYQRYEMMEEAFEQTVVAACRQLQEQMDAKAADIEDQSLLSAELTKTNEKMAQISLNESTKLLGKMVKEAFKNEKLQY